MMDIVERLAMDAHILHAASPHGFSAEGQAMTMAADEITRLRAEVEKWKTAFGAQSRKLQVALDAGGEPAREAVRAALHDGREDG